LFERQTIARLAQAIEGGAVTPSADITPTAPFELIDASIRAQLPAQVEDAYPATQMQLAMLYHSTVSDDRILYQDVLCYSLALPFDAAKLQRALHDLVARHDILRTSFDLGSYAQPLQLVHNVASAKLILRTGTTTRETFSEWFEREQREPIDWSAAPLMRVTAHPLEQDSFILAITFHHAILDGWSEASLIRELIETYSARLRNESVAKPPLNVSFRDFVRLELEAIASEKSDLFWKERTNAPAATVMDPVSEHKESGNREVARLALDAKTSDSLSRLSGMLGISLKSLLLAVHAKVLSTVSGSSDVVSGVTLNGRPETQGSQEILGLFINTVPMQLSLGTESWAAFAQQVFDFERSSLPHRRLPLQVMTRRHGRRVPFEVIFNYTHFHVSEGVYERAGGPVRTRGGYAATDVAWTMEFMVPPGESRVEGYLVFDTGRISGARVAQIVDIYHSAIALLLANPDRPHNAVPLIAPNLSRRPVKALARARTRANAGKTESDRRLNHAT
ncbi:MAG TPA: condensation domain-containing protein, partial [Steroidobacteraceae bacterium]|nr:condensation domain-containing protein [Steroidobacteraceae bacterium]